MTRQFPDATSATQVWLLRADVTAAHGREQRDLLSADERTRAEGFRAELDRNRYVAAHSYLRRLLAHHVGVEPAVLSFGRAEHGKPFLLSPARPDVHFNLTYSGDLCAVAIADGRHVGVDIERQTPIPFEPLVERHCSPSERGWLASLPAEDRLNGFYRCWTLKEAVLKASGRGLSEALQHVSVVSRSGDTIVDSRRELAESYYAVELDIPDGYAGAIALSGAAPSVVRVHFALD